MTETAPLNAESYRFPKPCSAAGTVLLHGFNGVGRLLLGNGRRVLKLDYEELLDQSCRMTGLEDFGPPPFEEGLRVLLASFDREADLNLVGRITVRSEMLRLLCNRLRMAEDRKRFAEIDSQVIRRPLFITGLPRSGTSFLHALLAQDPGCRVPQVWEVMHPSPPPAAASYASDPRIVCTEKELRWIDVLMPGFENCHYIDARSPQECIAITDHSFMSYLFESMYFVTSYRNWHDNQNKRPAYLFHRQFLQHLQSRCPGTHWVLKAPSHLMALKPILEVYPDAEIVMTHRDPLKVIPSTASFAEVLRAPFTNRAVRQGLGREVSRRWADSSRQAMELRRSRPELSSRFFDVSYCELVRDPLEAVRRIYRHFGRDLGSEAERRMRLFLERQPAEQGARHRYTLEEFGLKRSEEAENFREYTEYFGVASED